jgi:hypothetical protein
MTLGFEVLIMVVMRSYTFWDLIPCSPVKVNQALLLAGFLLSVLFNPENRGDMFLQNIG